MKKPRVRATAAVIAVTVSTLAVVIRPALDASETRRISSVLRA